MPSVFQKFKECGTELPEHPGEQVQHIPEQLFQSLNNRQESRRITKKDRRISGGLLRCSIWVASGEESPEEENSRYSCLMGEMGATGQQLAVMTHPYVVIFESKPILAQ